MYQGMPCSSTACSRWRLACLPWQEQGWLTVANNVALDPTPGSQVALRASSAVAAFTVGATALVKFGPAALSDGNVYFASLRKGFTLVDIAANVSSLSHAHQRPGAHLIHVTAWSLPLLGHTGTAATTRASSYDRFLEHHLQNM